MTTEEDVGKGAAIAIPAAAAACSVVPGIGTGVCAAGAAIGAALTAFGVWVSSASRDTYHPDTATAEALLTLARVHPPVLFLMDIDRAQDADMASRQARYLRVVSGEVPTGAKQNTGGLHNPHDKACDNPYQCNDDPDEPLTSLAFMQKQKDGFDAWVAQGGGATPASLARLPGYCPTPHARHPAEAAVVLTALRSAPTIFRDVMAKWPAFASRMDQMRVQVAALRRAAGEAPGTKDPVLDDLFAGDTDPAIAATPVTAAAKDPKLAGPGEVPAAPPSAPFFTLGRVVLALTVLSGGAAAWTLWTAHRAVSPRSPTTKKKRQP